MSTKSQNNNEIRSGESVSEWKKRLKRQNSAPEIDGGMLAPAVISVSPETKRGVYMMEKALRPRIGHITSDKAEEYIRDFEDSLKGSFITDPDMALMLNEAAQNLPHPHGGIREAQFNNAKQQYLDSLFPGNDIFSQAYRWWRRHGNHKPTTPSFRGIGADIVSLNNNVIRLTPDSEQSNALVNEFVESRYPSVLTAGEYRSDPNRIVGDMRQFPVSNINYYAGIEDGKFRIDELENFNDSTTVIPARNIKKDVPEIYGIRIDGLGGHGGSGTIYDSGYLSSIQNRIEDNSLIQNPDEAFPRYLQQKGIDAKRYEEELDNAIKNYVDTGEAIEYGVPYYPYSQKKLSDLSLYEKAKIDWERNYAEPVYTRIRPNYPDDWMVPLPSPTDIAVWDDGKDTDMERAARKRNAPYEKYENERYDFIGDVAPALSGEGIKNDQRYGFVDKDGNLHSISEYNADVLDGKTIIGNPNGSIFIGRIQDISKPQLDSLNNYLKDNPSRILRTDLGSFNQYRLDNPSLETYLKQYFEHPKAEDPNVYVIGTTEPNRIWNKYGGLIERLQKFYGDKAIDKVREFRDGGKMMADGGYVPSEDIKNYIKEQEAFRSKWYKDGNGIDTVGYGFTGKNVAKLYPNGMTKKEADDYFENLVDRFAKRMEQLTPNIDRLTQNQKDALFSYFYNIGEGNYSKGSPKMQQALRDFDLETVMQNIDAGYNDKKNPGLKKRRDYERELFGKDIQHNAQPIVQEEKTGMLYMPEIQRFNTQIPMANGETETVRPFLYDYRSVGKPLEIRPERNIATYSNPVPMPEYELPEITVTPTRKNTRPRLYDTLVPSIVRDLMSDLEVGGLLADYRSGGKIHIKPENRGKFTALLKRTGKSASWYKAHGTPLQRKRATFALNARKWKHADGGLIDRLNVHAGGDAARMLELIQKARRG